jgi:hypothetical protein
MLEILNQHLPPGGQDGDQNRLEPGKLLETRASRPAAAGLHTKDEVYMSSGPVVKLAEEQREACWRLWGPTSLMA